MSKASTWTSAPVWFVTVNSESGPHPRRHLLRSTIDGMTRPRRFNVPMSQL